LKCQASTQHQLRATIFNHRCAAPKRYTWEIFSEGKMLPADESTDQFRSWEEASHAGKKALKKLLANPVARPRHGF
jgi:hypothetical protein